MDRRLLAFLLAPLAPAAVAVYFQGEFQWIVLAAPIAYVLSMPWVAAFFLFQKYDWLRAWQVIGATTLFGVLESLLFRSGMPSWRDAQMFGAYGALAGLVFWIVAFGGQRQDAGLPFDANPSAVMEKSARSDRNGIAPNARWAILVLLLIVVAFAIGMGEGQIDQATKFICPQGWWYASSYGAHCAYPPVSMAKHGAMHAGYAVLALLLIQVTAPAYKQLAIRALLVTMMALPTFHLVLVKVSWVEVSKLFLVALVALVFGLYARAVRRLPNDADA